MNLYSEMKPFYITVLSLIMLFGMGRPSQTVAQPTEKNLYNFDYIKYSQGWLTSYNPSGLFVLPVKSTSVVEAFFNKENGAFTNFNLSDDSYKYGAYTESYMKMNNKVTFYGFVSYDSFTGKNMGGSPFIDPSKTPFDIVEYADDKRGVKVKETYKLIGGVGYNLWKGLHIGGKIDYSVADYFKIKDLRHYNSMLDLSLAVGATYSFKKLDIGINYYHRRNIESITFKIFGPTDMSYFSLISYGAFMGNREVFGEQGYTSNVNPLITKHHGGSLQLNLRLKKGIIFFNEFSFRVLKGHYGKLSDNYPIYTGHNGKEIEYFGLLSIPTISGSLHTVKLSGIYLNLLNEENIFKRVTVDGVNTIKYFGSNEVGKKNNINASLEYNANLGLKGYTPKWLVKGGVDALYRTTTASLYPYYRKQTIYSAIGFVSLGWNKVGNKGILGLRANVGYGLGGGTKANDGTYTPPTSSQGAPRNTPFYLDREYEFYTAHRVNASVGFRYSYFVQKGFTAYVDLNYNFTNAINVTAFNGNMRHMAAITLGCSF